VSVTLERKLSRRRMAHRIDAILPLDLSAQTPRLAATPAPIGKYGLWHVKGMQFPPYFQNVRNALIRSGHSVAEASQITWGAIRHWARAKKTAGEYGKGVHPEVVEAARAALAGIAKDQARAHAQRASHAHTNLVDKLILREFARSGRVIELADPYHDTAGKFTSSGNQGSAAAKVQPQKGTNQPKPISAKQKATYLKDAAADTAKANQLRAEAAKLNLQIQALSALIAQETKYLNTASTGSTSSSSGTTGTASGTSTTSTASGTSTTTSATGTTTSTANYNTPTTQQLLQQNLAQYKQLTTKRDQLLQQATVLDQQAANYQKLAAG